MTSGQSRDEIKTILLSNTVTLDLAISEIMFIILLYVYDKTCFAARLQTRLLACSTDYQLPTLLYSDNKANQIKIFTFRLNRLVIFFLPWTNFIKAVGKTLKSLYYLFPVC